MGIKMVKDARNADVVTHAGVFHADDVVATVILMRALKRELSVYRAFKVPDDLPEDVVVYDIGYGAFDHHQRGGNGCRENGVPYASTGLIWREYGRKLVEGLENSELVWELMDRDFIQAVDAVDNGALPKSDLPVRAVTLSQIVSKFNPNWDLPDEVPDERFKETVEMVDTIFEAFLNRVISKAKAQVIVDEAIEKADNHIMFLEQFVPWQEFVFSSKSEKASEIQFVVFPSNRGGYNWQCVPDCLGGFGQRKPVPAEWKGLSGADLQRVTGIDGAVFCHPSGFLGSANTLADAILMAIIAVEA